jgi:hypothetical protein
VKLALASLFLLSLACAYADAPAPLVTIDGGNMVDLCAGCATQQIRVTVTPTTKFRPTEDPIVSEVSVGALRDSSLRDAFKPKWEKGKENYPIALLVDVDAAKVAKAATYTVILNLLPSSQPDAPRLTLQVQHPAAQLQVPSKLIVHRVKWFQDDKQDLYFTEISGKSSITDLQVSPALQPSLLGNTPVTGQLHVPDPGKLEPSKTVKVNYDLTGDLPLGTVTGAVQIMAPQLAQTVPLNFEVTSRLPLFMVFIYALLGALTSWLLKVVLQTRIELNEARIKADDLLQRVEADVNKHLDSIFRSAIDQARTDLQAARAGKSAADIERYRQDLDQKWRDALKDLATRRQEVQKSFDDLRSVTDNRWQVPKILSSAIETGRQELEKVSAKLSNDDLVGAKTDLLALQNSLGLGIKLATVKWQQIMINYFDALQKPRGGISSALKAGLKSAVEKQQSALANTKDDTPNSTVADILHILSMLMISVAHVRDPLSQLKTELIAEIEQAEKKLAKAPDQAAIAKLKEETISFGAALPEVVDDPAPALDALPVRLASLDQAWRDALLAQLGSKDPKAVQASLNAQDYAGAVALTIAAYTGSTILSAVPASAAPSAWSSGLRADFVAGPIPSFRTSALGLDLPRTGEPAPLTPGCQLFREKSLQSLVLFVLVGLAGLMLYQNTFVGTFEDFAKIFFWAFGLDITFDAVRQATKPRSA